MDETFLWPVVELPKKMSRIDSLYANQKKYVGPTIAAVEVSRSTRSHPIENVRPLFYSKSTMLNIVKSLITFSRSLFVANERNCDLIARVWLLAPIPPSAGLQVDWE